MKQSVEIGFEKRRITVPLGNLVPVKLISATIKKTKKYQQIAISVKEAGIVEPLIIHRSGAPKGKYLLLDGHMRFEVLKELGQEDAPCLVAKDDEAFTYNKRINRLGSVQEHYMILRAIENGVPEERIANALGVNVARIRQKTKLLNGICPEAVDILKDRNFTSSTANVMKRMKPVRQIEMAELMVATNNFSISYARALLMATPANQLKEPTKKKPLGGLSDLERRNMEQEMEKLQRDIKAVEENYGTNMLRLVVANGYLGRLLENEPITGYLRRHHGELFQQLEAVQESIAADIGLTSHGS